jgi:tetratricopeptide (TPR) repeat protein
MKKLLLSLCCVACLSACAISTGVPYEVTSTPPGARIYVNGVSMGAAPVRIELACDKLWVCPADAPCSWVFSDHADEVTAYPPEDNSDVLQTKRIIACRLKAAAGKIEFDLASAKKAARAIAKDGAGMEDVNRGYKYLTQGQYAEAESYFHNALHADPRNPYALLDLGVVYQNTGHIDKAREMYRKVIDTGAQDIPKLINKKDIMGKSLSEIARDNLSALPADEKE